MSKQLMTRFLAAALLAVPFGLLFAARERARLVDWTSNPRAAEAKYVDFLNHASVGVALIATLILFLGVAIGIECVVFLLGRGWRTGTRSPAR